MAKDTLLQGANKLARSAPKVVDKEAQMQTVLVRSQTLMRCCVLIFDACLLFFSRWRRVGFCFVFDSLRSAFGFVGSSCFLERIHDAIQARRQG